MLHKSPMVLQDATYVGLLEGLKVGLWRFSVQRLVFLYCSQGLYELYETDRLEVLHNWEQWQRFIAPEDAARMEQAVLALRPGETGKIEFQIITGTGKRRWVLQWMKLVIEDGGPVIEGVVTDIDHLKNYQAQLESSQVLYKKLFYSNPVPMWVTDPQTMKFLEANDAAVANYGYSREEFLGMDITQIRPGEDHDKLRRWVAEDNREAITGTVWRHLTKNGRLLYVQIHYQQVEWQGRPARLVMGIDVTPLVKAQQHLAETRQQLEDFRYALNTSSLVAIIDAGGHIKYVNENLLNVTGYKEAELLKQHYSILLSKRNDMAQVKQLLRSTRRGRQDSLELRIKGKPRQQLWLDVKMVPINAAGERNYILICADITEKYKMQKALERREKLYTSIINASTNFVVRIDLEGHYTFVNRAFSQLFPPEMLPLTGASISEHFLAAEGEESINFHALKLQGSRRKQIVQMKMRLPGTEERYIEWEFIPVGSSARQVVEFQGIGRDITTHKQAEAEVVRYSGKLNTILNNMVDGFMTLDQNLNVLSLNRMAELLFTVRKEEVLSQPLFDLSNIELLQRIANDFMLYRQRNISFHTEHYLETLEGWYEVNAYPSPEGFAVYIKDITSRKKNEEEKAALLETLSAANKDLQEFAYVTSHNLRAPVANMMGLLGLIKSEQTSPEEAAAALGMLSKAVDRMNEVIVDLSAVLTIRNRHDVQKEEVPLDEIVAQVKDMLAQTLEHNHVDLKMDFGTPSLFAVRNYMNNILLNLIVNSVKYRKPDKEPVIEIISRQHSNFQYLTVKDNGMGLDLDKHGSRLFHLYKRFHTHVEGKGIGLYLVKSQVESMGGVINVNSKPGKGAEFTICLPAPEGGIRG